MKYIVNLLAISIFFTTLTLTPSAAATQCVAYPYQGKDYWACPANIQDNPRHPTIFEKKDFIKKNLKKCNSFCEQTVDVGTALAPDRLIDVNRTTNSEWVEGFREKKYRDSDAYTVYRMQIVGSRPSQISCRSYSQLEGLARKVLGITSVQKSTFSIVISEKPINPRSFADGAVVVPVFDMARRSDANCSMNYHLTDDIRVAKIVADSNIELHVRAIFTFNDDQTTFAGIEDTISGTLLGTMLNGALSTYAPIVTAFIGTDGLQTVRDENLSLGTSLVTYPGTEQYPAKLFQVRLGTDEVLSVKIFQEPGVSAQGILSGQRDLSGAINRQNTIAQLSSSRRTVDGASISDVLRGQRAIDFAIPREKSTTIEGMQTFCHRLRDDLADVATLSNLATYKLMALVMRDYHKRYEFYTTETGLNSCLPPEYHFAYKDFILEGYSQSNLDKIETAYNALAAPGL